LLTSAKTLVSKRNNYGNSGTYTDNTRPYDYDDHNTIGHGTIIWPQGTDENTIIVVDGDPITMGELIRLVRKMARILENEIDAVDVGEELSRDEVVMPDEPRIL